MLFDFFENRHKGWQAAGSAGQKLPLTEKQPDQQMHYPFEVKKVLLPDEIEIAYVDEGPQEGEVLLFVHGLAGGIPAWRKNIPVFRKKFRCIALDLPGHGFSTKSDFPYTMLFFTRVVLQFMDVLELKTAILVGHSMGGQIAILTALKAPERIERLVLVAPSGIEPYTPIEKQTLINMTIAMVSSGQAFTQYRMNYLMAFDHKPNEAGELVSQLAYYKNDGTHMGKLLLRGIEGMLLESVNHVLHQIVQPCLVLVGNDDKVSPYQYFHRQRFSEITSVEIAKIPRAKLVIFSPCGHYVQYQRPKSFNKEVEAFLTS